MAPDLRTHNADKTSETGSIMEPQVAKPYIVDMLEQLMLLAQSSNLRHLATGLDTLLEPYRD